MKLLLIFAFLVLVCMARSAPPPTTPRLLFPDYQDADQDGVVDNTNNQDDDDQENNEDPEEDPTTTTTTTTTRRSPYIPTRNRNVIPTRRPYPTSRFTPRTTTTTTTTAYDDEGETTDGGSQYDGDFKYIRDFRVYVQKLMDDIRKLVRNLTGYDFMKNQPRPQYNYPTNDD